MEPLNRKKAIISTLSAIQKLPRLTIRKPTAEERATPGLFRKNQQKALEGARQRSELKKLLRVKEGLVIDRPGDQQKLAKLTRAKK